MLVKQSKIFVCGHHGLVGSACIYSKYAPQSMKEDSLLTSPLEYTNEEEYVIKTVLAKYGIETNKE